MCSATDIAWLAGLLDGEASVGIVGGNGRALAAQVQLEMRGTVTVRHAADLCDRLGVIGGVYSYAPRRREHRETATYRVARLGGVLTLARAVAPYAVTKAEHWRVAIAFCESRLGGAGVDDARSTRAHGPDGRMLPRPITTQEWEWHEQLKALNRRGT